MQKTLLLTQNLQVNPTTIDPEIQNYVWEIEHKPLPENFINTLVNTRRFTQHTRRKH